ncbi:RNA polymerase sigma factor [Streptomyces sp. NPDC059063]|uniref:RNA polymerase sigma factor n=1 Tax=Streptomyces sp. NPDC059063 TaxID=3346712 RepID=UPI0036B65015
MAEPETVTAETLGRVFAQYRGEMTGKARQLLDDAGVPESVADADDIVSSALATALKDPGAVQRPRAYLYKLIRTEVVHLATRLGEHRRLDERQAADPLCCPAPDVADFSALVDNRDAVHRAAQGLTVPQRTAVWATCALDYSRGETAVLMGKHPGTVARHCSRAMLLLRAAIAAAVVGVLTVLGLAAGGALQRATPADGPHRDPVLPQEGWWTEKWTVPVITLTLAVYSVRALRRLLQDLPDRDATTSPLRAMLCFRCHRRVDREGLTRDERLSLLHHRVKSTPQGGSSLMSCQLCGHSASLAGPIDSVSLPGMKVLTTYELQCATCQRPSPHRLLTIGEYDALGEHRKGPLLLCMTKDCNTVRPRRYRLLGRRWSIRLVTSGTRKQTAEPTSAASDGAQPLGARKSRRLDPAMEETSVLPPHQQFDAIQAVLESSSLAAVVDRPSQQQVCVRFGEASRSAYPAGPPAGGSASSLVASYDSRED